MRTTGTVIIAAALLITSACFEDHIACRTSQTGQGQGKAQ